MAVVKAAELLCAGCGAEDDLYPTQFDELACPFCNYCDWCGELTANGNLSETRGGELICRGCE